MTGGSREGLKNVARGLAFLASYRFKCVFIGVNRALEGSSQVLSLVPGLPGRYMRQVFFSRVLAHCSRSVVIEFGTLFSQSGARLDDGVYIGPRCHLGLVHIGADAMLGPCVQVPSGAHTHEHSSMDVSIQSQGLARQLVHIGEGCWIGGNAVIMADVGANTIIGAGAVVTRPIPPNVVAAGIPARVIKERSTGDVTP